jgi:hypothetical protein
VRPISPVATAQRIDQPPHRITFSVNPKEFLFRNFGQIFAQQHEIPGLFQFTARYLKHAQKLSGGSPPKPFRNIRGNAGRRSSDLRNDPVEVFPREP